MEYKVDRKLRDFEFWAGAQSTAKLLTWDDFDTIEEGIIECTAEGDMWTETDINDFFWFDTDVIAAWLGYNNFEELYNERAK